MKKNINNVSSSQTNKTILLVISAVVIIIIAILAVKLFNGNVVGQAGEILIAQEDQNCEWCPVDFICQDGNCVHKCMSEGNCESLRQCGDIQCPENFHCADWGGGNRVCEYNCDDITACGNPIECDELQYNEYSQCPSGFRCMGGCVSDCVDPTNQPNYDIKDGVYLFNFMAPSFAYPGSPGSAGKIEIEDRCEDANTLYEVFCDQNTHDFEFLEYLCPNGCLNGACKCTPTTEICDKKDNDCDSLIDEDASGVNQGLQLQYRDWDKDGYGSKISAKSCTLYAGYVRNNLDCNDANKYIKPGAGC